MSTFLVLKGGLFTASTTSVDSRIHTNDCWPLLDILHTLAESLKVSGTEFGLDLPGRAYKSPRDSQKWGGEITSKLPFSPVAFQILLNGGLDSRDSFSIYIFFLCYDLYFLVLWLFHLI
jgi:hypothetical protein